MFSVPKRHIVNEILGSHGSARSCFYVLQRNLPNLSPSYSYSRKQETWFPHLRLHIAVTKAKYFLSASWMHVGGIEVQLRSFLTSAIEADEWSSRSGHFIPEKELRHPRSVWLGGHRSRFGRFGGDISFPCRELNRYSSVRPVTKSLFRLSYSNSWK
jgi:hypothetical protein